VLPDVVDVQMFAWFYYQIRKRSSRSGLEAISGDGTLKGLRRPELRVRRTVDLAIPPAPIAAVIR